MNLARAAGLALLLLVGTTTADADPVRVVYPEGFAHGFLALSDLGDNPLAHGELIQWVEGRVVASELVFRFDDGSLYDELVRFTQRPYFRVESYHLVQRGPSFTETTDVRFDRSGRYDVTRRAKPGEAEEHAGGQVDVPEDVSNGMISTLLKNLPAGTSATTHLLAFRPKPLTLEVALGPEGSDPYWVGSAQATATRFLVQPRVGGVAGAIASVAGKQPPALRMWIAQGRAPSLLRFEGPVYTDGPPWRVELSAPSWAPPAVGSRTR